MALQFVLPQDIIIEILQKLPIKTLVRFKSVCKTWLALILDPHFQAMKRKIIITLDKYDTSNSTCPVRPVIMSCSGTSYWKYDTISHRHIDLEKLPEKLRFIHKHSRDSKNVFVFTDGPCSGVFLLYNLYGNIALWNHATRDHKILSHSQDYMYSHDIVLFGEVLEAGVRDFVVLRLHLKDTRDELPELYRLSTGEWKVLKPNLPMKYVSRWIKYDHKVCINGIFYWFAYFKKSTFIVSFDSRSETFRLVKDIPADFSLFDVKLACYTSNDQKFLSVVVKNDNKELDLWVMRESGFERSWVKKESMGYDAVINQRTNILDDVWSNAVLYEESLVSF